MTTRKAREPRAAEWLSSAQEIPAEQVSQAGALSLTQLCDATGTKTSSIMSYVNRTGQMREDVPMAHLMRPAYRVGSVPYWSQDQATRYFDAHAERTRRRRERIANLPEVTQREADRRGLWGLRKFAAWSGFALTTVHRWKNDDSFPEPVAVIPSSGPNPYIVWRRKEVETWVRARQPAWQPPKKS